MDSRTVMFSVSQLRIVTARHILGEAGIESFAMDKKDSAHAGLFGHIELLVPAERAAEARMLLLQEGIIEDEEE